MNVECLSHALVFRLTVQAPPPLSNQRWPSGANGFGLHDMAGNVREWTSTQAKEYPYEAGDGREGLPRGPSDTGRVVALPGPRPPSGVYPLHVVA